MNLNDLEKSLRILKGSSVQVSANADWAPKAGEASVRLVFSEGSKLRAGCARWEGQDKQF